MSDSTKKIFSQKATEQSTREYKFVDLAPFKALADGHGGFEGYGNNLGSLDSYDDITVAGCFKESLAEFIQAGWTAPDHDWGIKDEIGIIVDAHEDEQGLFIRSEFHPTDDAQQVRLKVKNRLDKGKSVKLSIGYVAEEWRYVTGFEAIEYVKNPTPEIIERLKRTARVRLLLKVKLYEVSIVSVGAEPKAAVTEVKGAFSNAAAGAEHTGLFVGFFLSPESAQALALEGGEAADQLHLTLCYCGDVAALDDMTVAKAMVAVKDLASWRTPLTGRVSGLGTFSPTKNSDNKSVLYASVDMPGLAELYCWVAYVLECAGVAPRRDHGFDPHITLAYVEANAEPPKIEKFQPIALRFDALAIVIGEERTIIPLSGYPQSSCSPYMYLSDGKANAEFKEEESLSAQHGLLAGLKFAVHSDKVLATVKEFVTRGRSIQAYRVKEGRTISAANRERMQSAMTRIKEASEAMQQVHDDMDALCKDAEPKPKSDTSERALKLRRDFLITEAANVGIAVPQE